METASPPGRQAGSMRWMPIHGTGTQASRHNFTCSLHLHFLEPLPVHLPSRVSVRVRARHDDCSGQWRRADRPSSESCQSSSILLAADRIQQVVVTTPEPNKSQARLIRILASAGEPTPRPPLSAVSALPIAPIPSLSHAAHPIPLFSVYNPDHSCPSWLG